MVKLFVLKPSFYFLLLTLFLSQQANAQFRDDFSGGQLQKDPSGINGWAYFTGDGMASIEFEAGDGQATISVDATQDRQNIWWALIKRQVSSYINLKRLSKPEYELQVEARIRLSHAPRRVNLSVNSQRTTDFHTNLMEFYIDDTLNWHTISFTTRNFEAQPGDTIFAQLALMDWGLERYKMELDYFNVEVVKATTAGPDKGIATLYHPPQPPVDSLQYHLPVAADATIDLQYPDMNFNNWSAQDGKEQTTLLNVNGTQYTILRWDLAKMEGRNAKGVGLLELSTYDIQRTPDYQKDFGMVRVVEILDGAPEWTEQEITLQKLSQGKNLKEIFNPQMIIDVKIVSAGDGRNYITIPEHIIQRMLEGKTRGIVLQPLGAVNASFYARENQDAQRSPKLHFNLEEKEKE